MNKRLFIPACLLAIIALVLNFQLAFAHESIIVGDYTLEVGWANEPPVAGQSNAIEVHVSMTADEQPVEDVSSLTLTISYGGQSKTLAFEPVDEHSPGLFMAPIVPTIPGQYSVHFGGSLGDTPVDAEVDPEEVQPADTLQFPSEASEGSVTSAGQSADLGMLNWLIYLSLLIGLTALILGVMALRKAR